MNTVKTIYFSGIITLSMLSILGLIYITKMTFSNTCNLKHTEKNIARMTSIILWIQILWILVGGILQEMCYHSIFK